MADGVAGLVTRDLLECLSLVLGVRLDDGRAPVLGVPGAVIGFSTVCCKIPGILHSPLPPGVCGNVGGSICDRVCGVDTGVSCILDGPAPVG